jgi:molybdopterin-guanine dinucleotide biosynthesis protein A
MLDKSDITLAILAGGEGRRMQTPKGLLRLHDKPILSLLHERLAWPGPIVLVTAPGREKPPGHELFSAEAVDNVGGRGPLQGVLTALKQTQTSFLVAAPLDMPRLNAQMLAFLASALAHNPNKSAAMFERQYAGHPQIEPLPAAFAVGPALEIVQESLTKGRSALRDLADRSITLTVPCPPLWPADLWINLNYPQDVQQYLNRELLYETSNS